MPLGLKIWKLLYILQEINLCNQRHGVFIFFCEMHVAMIVCGVVLCLGSTLCAKREDLIVTAHGMHA